MSEIQTSEIVVGIETEFGIIRKDRDESDPVRESMDLVKAYRPPSFGAWAYEAEDPRVDARGFRVDRLAQDEEEEAFVRSEHHREFSFRESKSDRILQNGARFYNDHTHPEYSTPECRSLRDLVLYDRAGTSIVRAAKDSRSLRSESQDRSGYIVTIPIFTDTVTGVTKTIFSPGPFLLKGSWMA